MAETINDKRERSDRLIARAENTRNTYVSNVLDTRRKIAPYRGTRNYTNVVRREIPGAPVYSHCLYSQYEMLMRALEENGDTLTIVPQAGSRACIAFKNQMRQKYGNPEYAGCIQEGRAFESDSAYNAALAKYLRANGIRDTAPSERRDMLAANFARSNFSVDDVTPGSIWIVPRYRGAKNKFHAIMFLGRGKIENGVFIPTADGKPMYAGFNNESIGDVFKSYDMSNVFSASVEDILNIEYGKELQRLESLPTDKMIEYIVNGTNIQPANLRRLPRKELLRMVRNKYFGTPMTIPAKQPEQIAQADIPPAVLQNLLFERV